MSWINEYIDNYYHFLREKTVLREDPHSGWVAISTPFLGAFNDAIEIYAKKQNGHVLLSDDGETLRNLELNGVQLSRSARRRELLDQILLNYGVRVQNNELCTEATEQNFPQKKLNLLAAISETNDLYYLAKHTVASVFREDVREYLEEQDIIYTPHFIAKGSTGLEFTFDFQIAYRQTEIVVKSFNFLNKLNLPHFLFTWDDIRKVREKQSEKRVVGLAVINDQDHEIKGELLDAIQSQGAEYILWSQRHQEHNIIKLQEAA
ncbi:DUF1828 domain-containing protein [Telluribacter sp.]|jgi:hypothetical protein|uniref:DUF1828 domain-containing protein n=1 Tax=Telluribacter sp. TaxID=1978767 RepID=UPI002E0F0538|nr:DUF1828 domain-containing protein [Telluribacter sp.]